MANERTLEMSTIYINNAKTSWGAQLETNLVFI